MTDTEHRPQPPWVYSVLYAPFGIGVGYVTVTLAWLLSHAGASVAAVAVLGSMGLLPNTWKVLWAPAIDTLLSSKAWLVIGVATMSAAITVTAVLPPRTDLLPAFDALAAIVCFFGTVTAISVDRLMAFDTPDEAKGRAGGWSQAGNLGGAGLGGGLGLWLAQHSGHSWLGGVVLVPVCAACCLPLLRLKEPGRVKADGGYLAVLVETGRDTLSLLRRRIGLLACFIMVLPIGSGGLQQIWPAIAKDWNAGADEVALVGGLLSGLVSIPGCIISGVVADRIDRKLAYAIFGVALSGVAVAMALGPRTPVAFLVFACLYNATVGFSYGAYSAVTLEAIGKGAAGTKYNLISSLSNVPILIVTLVDGWAAAKFGVTGMLYVEASLGVAGVVLYGLIAWATRGLSWGVIFGRGRISPAG
jgi:MFS family permease